VEGTILHSGRGEPIAAQKAGAGALCRAGYAQADLLAVPAVQLTTPTLLPGAAAHAPGPSGGCEAAEG
jgi:hypothetical protein